MFAPTFKLKLPRRRNTILGGIDLTSQLLYYSVYLACDIYTLVFSVLIEKSYKNKNSSWLEIFFHLLHVTRYLNRLDFKMLSNLRIPNISYCHPVNQMLQIHNNLLKTLLPTKYSRKISKLLSQRLMNSVQTIYDKKHHSILWFTMVNV